MELSEEQRARYQRNILAPGFGEAGQARLGQGRVLIVGLGGLGSPAALYLAAAGVGTLGLLDSDQVERSNLQRQILHGTGDLGRAKTESAARAVEELNPHVRIECIEQRLTAENGARIIGPFDAVVEATDRFETKFLINDVCLQLKKPFATAGILGWTGHGLFVVPGKTACLRCALPEPPPNAPTTAELGVIGAVAGAMGCLEALEVVRWLAGLWRPRPDGAARLHSLDGETMRLNTLNVRPQPGCRCART